MSWSRKRSKSAVNSGAGCSVDAAAPLSATYGAEERIVCVTTVGGEVVVAMANLQVQGKGDARTLMVWDLCVRRDYRNLGLCSKLLRRILSENWANYAAIHMTVLPDNKVAYRCFTRCGMKAIGVRGSKGGRTLTLLAYYPS